MMLSSVVKPAASAALCLSAQTRNMATLKDIAMRLKSVKNIQKITKSMKMVSAAKYAKAERDLRPARPYGQGAKEFYEKAEVAVPDEAKCKHVILAVASDRGLCGSANSSIAKAVKFYIQENPDEAENTKVICVGDKTRSMLHRQYGQHILAHCTEVGKKPPTFQDASILAEELLSSGVEFDKISMYYNKFKSVISYDTTLQPLYSLTALSATEKINMYDSVDDEVLRSYNEYLLTSLIFYALKEAQVSEQSARMTAMENATKNAGEMIDKLTLLYNRTRQAAITRELTEIISGAAAV